MHFFGVTLGCMGGFARALALFAVGCGAQSYPPEAIATEQDQLTGTWAVEAENPSCLHMLTVEPPELVSSLVCLLPPAQVGPRGELLGEHNERARFELHGDRAVGEVVGTSCEPARKADTSYVIELLEPDALLFGEDGAPSVYRRYDDPLGGSLTRLGCFGTDGHFEPRDGR